MSQSFPHRYAANWRSIRQQTLQLTGGCCCLCAGRAKEVHHARYGLWDGKRYQSIAGKEHPLVDVFPLCNSCHTLAHAPQNWVWDKQNPALGNHNQPAFVERLQASLAPVRKPASVLPANTEPSWVNVVNMAFRLLFV
jgi:hypothetical protein